MLRLKPSPSENVTQGLCYSPGCGQHLGGHDAGCSVASHDFGADIGVPAGVPCHSRCSTAPTSPAPFPIWRATSRRRLLTEKVRHGFRPAICGVIWRRSPTGTEPSSAGGSPALTPPRGAFGRRCTNGRCLGQAASGEGRLAAMPCRPTPPKRLVNGPPETGPDEAPGDGFVASAWSHNARVEAGPRCLRHALATIWARVSGALSTVGVCGSALRGARGTGTTAFHRAAEPAPSDRQAVVIAG